MTVENENYRNDYDGDDSTTVFPVDFPFLDETHLEVFITQSDGTRVDQVLNTDYTVSGGDPSGSITMVTAPATGEQLTILREVPLTQLVDYIPNSNFPAESHEDALDKLTMIAQEQAEQVSRNFRISESYDADDYDLEIDPDSDAFLVWNSAGTKVISKDADEAGDLIHVEVLYYNGTPVLNTVAGGIQFDGDGLDFISEFSKDGTLAGNSDNALPTEQAVKTYADDQDFGYIHDEGSGSIKPKTQEFSVLGSTGIETFAAPQGVGVRIDNTVVTLTGTQTLTNKTLNDAILNNPTINGGNIQIDDWILGDNEKITFGDGPDAQMYSDGDMLVIKDGGDVDTLMTFPVPGSGPRLFYDAKETIRTIQSGLQIFDWNNAAYTGVFRYYIGSLMMQGLYPGGDIRLTARNTGDTADHFLLIGQPDASVYLYYNNVYRFQTLSTGVQIFNQLDVGTADDTKGELRLYSDGAGAATGGRINFMTSPDYDTTIDMYRIQSYEDDFYIGPITNTDSLKYSGAGNYWNFTEGLMRLGLVDNVRGEIYIYGQGTGSDLGGLINILPAQDYRVISDSYTIRAQNANLQIGPAANTDSFTYKGAINVWSFTEGNVEIGVNDNINGELYLYGDGAGSVNGGIVFLYTAADHDSTIGYYCMQANQDDLLIGPAIDIDALKYSGNTGAWIMSHDGSETFYTHTDGIGVYGSNTSYNFDVYLSSTNTYLRSNTTGANLRFQATKTGDVIQSVYLYEPDTPKHYWYLDDSTAMNLDVDGLQVTGTRSMDLNTNAGELKIYANDGGWQMGTSFYGPSLAKLGMVGSYGTSDALNWYFIGEAYNSNLCFKAVPGGEVELYHNYLSTLKTTAVGIAIYAAGSQQLNVNYSSSVWELYSLAHGAPIALRGENASGTAKYVLYGDPDGDATLYHAGDPAIRAITYGMQVFNTATYSAYILTGAGSPEGVFTAPVGSLFLRTDGGTGTSLYVKESGTGNTGWVAK